MIVDLLLAWLIVIMLAVTLGQRLASLRRTRRSAQSRARHETRMEHDARVARKALRMWTEKEVP